MTSANYRAIAVKCRLEQRRKDVAGTSPDDRATSVKELCDSSGQMIATVLKATVWSKAYARCPPVPDYQPTCDALPGGGGLWISVLRCFVIHFCDGSAYGLPLQPDAVCVVIDAIGTGVGEWRLADDVALRFHGQLAGDHEEAASVSLLDNLHQISTAAEPSVGLAPNHQRFAAGIRISSGAFGVLRNRWRKRPFLWVRSSASKRARHPFVNHGDGVTKGRLRQQAHSDLGEDRDIRTDTRGPGLDRGAAPNLRGPCAARAWLENQSGRDWV